MRSVFLWSDWGSTAFLGHWLKRAGIPVTLYIKDEASRDIARGLLPKTTDPNPPKEALVIFDGIGHGALGQTLRKRGQLVVGGNPLDHDLEEDRYAGIRIMQKAGIATPRTKQFAQVAGARAFLEEAQGSHWFLKVSGTSVSEASTCNGDTETLLRYLSYIAQQPGDKAFILQEHAEGVEVSTNGWFNGHQFVPPFDGTFEEKKLLTGDLGPRTGCEHCVVWLHGSQARLPQETVGKIADVLREARYVGPVDLNAIIAKDGTIYGLEWTARLGFDATQAWIRFFPSAKEFVQQLEAFAAGFLSRWETGGTGYASTIRISLPPYPNSNRIENKRMRGWPLDKQWLRDGFYCPEDVMAGEEGPVSAGASGLTGVISELNTDFKLGLRNLLRIAHSLKTPMQQFRTDILSRAEEDWKSLEKLGLISPVGILS